MVLKIERTLELRYPVGEFLAQKCLFHNLESQRCLRCSLNDLGDIADISLRIL